MDKELTHVNKKGKASMVDVSHKPNQMREACAEGFISMQPSTISLIQKNEMKKGDVLAVSQIAGITAGKKTSDLIPLCHPLSISKVDVSFELESDKIRVRSYVKTTGPTGVEVEALTVVSVSLLTLYDMCKAVDKHMRIQDIHLIEKKKTDIVV